MFLGTLIQLVIELCLSGTLYFVAGNSAIRVDVWLESVFHIAFSDVTSELQLDYLALLMYLHSNVYCFAAQDRMW